MPDYISGFCGIKACEGQAPKNTFGHPLPTCRFDSKTCACACHKLYDQMYSMAEMDRTLVNNSMYVPDKGDFIMPSWDEIAAARVLSASRPGTVLERTESPLPDAVPATVTRAFVTPPSGFAAPGQLEAQVDAMCKIWVVERDIPMCTPGYVSEQIARTYSIKEPSVGAIGAVFDRWVKFGYADCQRKPVRFVSFTELGIKLGLDGCRERYRASQRSKA